MPEGAVSVSIVLLYTDILQGPAAETSSVQTTGHGDLPAIIGSWTGKLQNGKWVFTTQPGDVNIITRNSEERCPRGVGVETGDSIGIIEGHFGN